MPACVERLLISVSRLKFIKHLVGWDKERILLEDAVDNDHGVSTHDVHYHASAEPGQVVTQMTELWYPGRHNWSMSHTRRLVNVRQVFERPLHVSNNPGKLARFGLLRSSIS